jgi:dienelactone hydrolase
MAVPRALAGMKKLLPMVWKYLAVVACSCALAFVISQNSARAAEDAGLPATDYAAAGKRVVSVTEANWQDAKRNRGVPVRIYSPAVPEAKADASATPSPRDPVILFSHGLGGNRDGGKLWASHWASHGFVVVVMQHPGSDDSLWKGRAPGDIEKSLKSGMTLGNLALRVGDVHFVIDEIIRRTASAEAPFAGADAKRIGLSGHSFGAQTTLAVSGQKSPILSGQSGLDVRVTSAVAFSPNARNKLNLARQFGDIAIPFFSITGTRDGSILDDGTRYEDRVKPYEHMPAGRKYLAVFDGGDHMVFGGHELGARRKETSRDREIQADVKAGTLAFWNATLRDDEAARRWLEGGGFKSQLEAGDRFASK